MSFPKGDASGGGLPPQRLIDTGARADGEEFGVDLLREAEPTQASSFRKQRIRAALGQRAVRRAPLALRPVIIVGVLGCAAMASAALGHWPSWIQKAYRQVVTTPSTETTATTSKVTRPPGARRAEALAAEVPVIAQAGAGQELTAPREVTHEERSAAPVTTVSSPRARRAPRLALAREVPAATPHETVIVSPVAVPRSEAPAAPSPPTSPPPAARAKATTPVRSTEDTAAVSQAMRALRIDRDPVRARVLARQYLDQYPNGALAEEALVLSIEAAATHHDADTASLAARYLRLYPSGSFRARVQRAAASP